MTYQPLKDVNPVPFEDSLPAGMWDSTALLDVIDERNGWMDTKQLMRAPEPETTKRGWAIALLAAAAVAVIAIGTIVLTGSTDGDLPPATDNTPVTSTTLESAPVTEAAAPTTTLDAVTTTVVDTTLSAQDQAFVEGLVAAFNSYDEANLVSFFSPNAAVENNLSGETDIDGFVRELPWRWAMNEQWEIVTCERLSAISCTFTITNDATSYRFGPPSAGVRIEVVDGAIVDLVMNENLGVIGPTLQPFYDWLDARDPALRNKMVSGSDPGAPMLDQESTDLWLELLPIYKAEAGF